MSAVMQDALRAKQAAVLQAESDLRAAKVENARELLRQVRASGREVKKAFDAAMAEFKRGETEVFRAKEKLAQIDARLKLLCAPDALDDFPSDQELADAKSERVLLEEQRRAAVLKARDANAATSPSRLRAIDLDQQLVSLRYKARALQTIISGTEDVWYKGGISAV
jgi:chromosome segregation ATPase